MNKAHILKLLDEKAFIQEEMKNLDSSLAFSSNTILERTRLRNRLFKLTNELSAYTPDQISIALKAKEKAKAFIKKHTQEDEPELVLVDNSFMRFLLYALLLQSAKPENKLFFALAINSIFGDTYERRYKNN
ncbi:hypothetical protein [Burkholderia vietnamiensis]|uniref:hypothetical protein n=1 Tax=Burkholderia vietnamiensis TaxID=60552 RepID=UPI0012DB4763|nr:hypothetical protein [Burkholderia vietnamiensis]